MSILNDSPITFQPNGPHQCMKTKIQKKPYFSTEMIGLPLKDEMEVVSKKLNEDGDMKVSLRKGSNNWRVDKKVIVSFRSPITHKTNI